MPLKDDSESALKVFYKAHSFIHEHGIHWLPINPEDIIDKNPNWHLKYVSQLAYELGKPEQYILDHVMRSQDGLSMYDVGRGIYDIIINAADGIPPGRVLWTKLHEIGHIYLGHLADNRLTEIRKEALSPELYARLEFEADMFAGEVLASKWLMRSLEIYDERDITLLCGISDGAALIRYKKATEDYQFTPANVTFTLHQFEAYLKEITVCCRKEDMELAKFARENQPRAKFTKPKAPFLRAAGSCPYCGGSHSPDANYCPHCGTALKKGEMCGGGPCGNIQPADAAFCERCGNTVFRIRQGFCFEECEI